jgi:RNA polymerase sigma factor (sigma-70 family)
LVAAVRAGDDHAFEELYHRYQRRIGAYIYGMVHDHGRAEDITQDVFMSALRRMRATETPIAFKPWVYEIAKNACIDAFRRSKRAEEISYDADDGSDRLHLVSKGPSPEAAVDTRMSLENLRGAFGGLSEAHHQILVMRELEGLSYRQIGERLGMSRPSVESTLFRARRRLSEEYEELVSGERCRRIQSIIAAATGGRAGTRDERKMARHVSYCQPCRRAAFAAGFDLDSLGRKRTAREKIAALLPLPAFLKRRLAGHGGDDDVSLTSMSAHGATLAQLSTAAAHYADPVMHGWGKTAAVVATVALAGVGAGFAGHEAGVLGGPRDERAAPLVRQAAPGAGDALSTRPASNTTGAPTGGGSTTPAGTSGSGGHSGSGSAGGSGSSTGSQSSSAPSSDSPLSSATNQPLPSATDNPVTKTVRRLTKPGSRGVPVKTPTVPKVEVPKVEVPTLPNPPGSVPDPGGVVSGATGAVNDATGAATGAVNGATGTAGGAVNGATGTAGGAVNGATGAAGGAVGGATGAVGGAVGGATGAVGGAVGGTVGGVTGGGGILGGG